MAENSKISWTDHTFNPWWGCVNVSPACDNCYAESFSNRMGQKLWGSESQRRFFGDKHWNEPLKWNRDALKDFGRPARVFCASMADVFEVRADLEPHRERLWKLIEVTPNLRWNLLTKRHLEIAAHKLKWGKLPNVHPGVTVESQTYDFRITPDVEWLSCEPLLGPLDLAPFLFKELPLLTDSNLSAATSKNPFVVDVTAIKERVLIPCSGLEWIIIGGESGHGAREMKLEWALSLIEQCKAAGVAVHFKQTGDVLARKLGLKDKSGKDPQEWPAELQIQEFPDRREAQGERR